MTDRSASGAGVPAARGSLCTTCLHLALVHSPRGSTFLRCGRARVDARFAKYPPQPVVRCVGHEEAAP